MAADGSKWVAASVHAFTASGAVCALFATLAIADRSAERLFLWLGIALIVDGIDGTFARAARVKAVLPRWSGETLDLCVDYITYVFVPVLALIAWKHLEGAFGLVLAAGILMSSLYHFADTESKDADYCFVGFPAVWNVVAFLVFALALPQVATMALVLLAIAGTFIPMPWIHPLRVLSWRIPTALILAAATIAALSTLWNGFPASPAAATVIAAAALYFVAFSTVHYMSAKSRP